MTLAIVLLAAGKGTRMNSKKQKILHDVGGKPMVQHVFEAAENVADLPPVLVAAPGETGVHDLFGERAEYVVQEKQLGTGHATMVVRSSLQNRATQVIITYGDMPLLKAETLQKLADKHAESGAAIVLLSVMGEPSSSFGRVLRGADGGVLEIVEVAEAKQRPNTDDILNVRELNAGVYCFAADFLWQHIDQLPLRQARSGVEYYLTDMVETAVSQNLRVEAIATDDPDECLGAGTRAEMVLVEQAFRRRANNKWLANGVTLVDPATTFIDPDVTIGQDTVIWPNTFLQGKTTVGEDCVIGPNTILRNATIGNACIIEQAVVENTEVVGGTAVDQFSVVRGQYSVASAED